MNAAVCTMQGGGGKLNAVIRNNCNAELQKAWYCGSTGTDTTVPTNTVQVQITTGIQ